MTNNRKKVLDYFIEKTELLKPAIEKRFNKVRNLYRKEIPYFDLQGCHHEFGHTIHATSIDPILDYGKKFHIPMETTKYFQFSLKD